MKVQGKVIYTAVFLTPESQQQLLATYAAIFPNHFAHHSTIEFRPLSPAIPLGDKYSLIVTGSVADDKAQAVLVEYKFSK